MPQFTSSRSELLSEAARLLVQARTAGTKLSEDAISATEHEISQARRPERLAIVGKTRGVPNSQSDRGAQNHATANIPDFQEWSSEPTNEHGSVELLGEMEWINEPTNRLESVESIAQREWLEQNGHTHCASPSENSDNPRDRIHSLWERRRDGTQTLLTPLGLSIGIADEPSSSAPL